MAKALNEREIKWLIENYPLLGKKACMEYLGKKESTIRQYASDLKLRQDRNSDFFKEWQERARLSKIGKKRPEQALVIKKNHEQGKFKMMINARKIYQTE